MIAIWPMGPPKEMNPSLSQNRKASPKEGLGVLFESSSVAELLVSELLCRTGPSSLCWSIISGIVTSLRKDSALFPSHCRYIERKTNGAEGTAQPERSRMVPTPEGPRRDPDWHNCKASSGIIGAHSSTALLRLLSRVNDGRFPCRLADFLQASDYEGKE